MKEASWRLPVVSGLVGVLLLVAGAFSRLTNPPLPLVASLGLGVSGVIVVLFYIKSRARDRESRLTPLLSEEIRERLRRQRPISILLFIAFVGLVGIPFVMSFFALSISPPLYNAVIGCCFFGMVIWCVIAAFGHWARHKLLDEHEQMVGDHFHQDVR